MLPKRHRLKSSAAFTATYNNHNIVSDGNVCIYLGRLKSDPAFFTRTAFIVSKKVHKRAVVRNRIKRYMRESVRLVLKNNEIPCIHNYLSIICLAKNAAVSASFKDIDASIRTLLNSCGSR